MRKFILIIFGILSFYRSGISQEISDSLIMYYSHSNVIAIQDFDKQLYSSDIRVLFANHKDALEEFEIGKTNLKVGNIIGIPSAFLLGYGVGMVVSGKDVNHAVWIVGGAGVVTSIIFRSLGISSVRESVRLYNLKIESTKSAYLDLGFTKNGYGLSLKF